METWKDYVYEVNGEGKAEIVRYEGRGLTAAVPDRIGDLPVTAIRGQAFMTATAIEIIVPEGIETIGAEAFALCDDLRRVTLPGSLKELGPSAFKGSGQLWKIVVSAENPRYYVEDGVLYDRPGQTLVCCPPGLETETFIIPAGIGTIGADAFFANKRLRFVEISPTVRKIETGAFLFTDALRIITLPPTVEEIEPWCFLLRLRPYPEKQFEIYAFPDTVGYRYAVENGIRVRPLSIMITDG